MLASKNDKINRNHGIFRRTLVTQTSSVGPVAIPRKVDTYDYYWSSLLKFRYPDP